MQHVPKLVFGESVLKPYLVAFKPSYRVLMRIGGRFEQPFFTDQKLSVRGIINKSSATSYKTQADMFIKYLPHTIFFYVKPQNDLSILRDNFRGRASFF